MVSLAPKSTNITSVAKVLHLMTGDLMLIVFVWSRIRVNSLQSRCLLSPESPNLAGMFGSITMGVMVVKHNVPWVTVVTNYAPPETESKNSLPPLVLIGLGCVDRLLQGQHLLPMSFPGLADSGNAITDLPFLQLGHTSRAVLGWKKVRRLPNHQNYTKAIHSNSFS